MKKNQFMASATVFMITSFRPKKKKNHHQQRQP